MPSWSSGRRRCCCRPTPSRPGPLAASQPGFTIVDPLVASLLGVFIFEEHLQLSPFAVVVEAARWGPWWPGSSPSAAASSSRARPTRTKPACGRCPPHSTCATPRAELNDRRRTQQRLFLFQVTVFPRDSVPGRRRDRLASTSRCSTCGPRSTPGSSGGQWAPVVGASNGRPRVRSDR